MFSLIKNQTQLIGVFPNDWLNVAFDTNTYDYVCLQLRDVCGVIDLDKKDQSTTINPSMRVEDAAGVVSTINKRFKLAQKNTAQPRMGVEQAAGVVSTINKRFQMAQRNNRQHN